MINKGWDDGLGTSSRVTVGKLVAWEPLAAWGVTFSVGKNGDGR
jgi:hypothetical protein